MSKYIGRVVDVGIGRETSRGGGVAPAYWLPKVSFDFDDKVTKARETASVGKLADSDAAFVTTKYGQGDLEGEIRDKSFGLLLYSMLGTLSTSAPTDSAYTHSFSIAESAQHQSLALVVQDPNTNEMYKLVMLDSLEITAELDKVVGFKASFMGKQSTGMSAAATVAYGTENKFTKKHIAVKFAANIAGLAAATAVSLKSLSLKIEKNVTMDDVLGTVEPEDFLNRQLSVEAEIELNYEDETFKNYMKNGTMRAMEIKLDNTDALIGVTSRPSLTIQMPNVDVYDWSADYNNDEIVRQTVSIKANEDVVNSLAIISTCQLVNGVASY